MKLTWMEWDAKRGQLEAHITSYQHDLTRATTETQKARLNARISSLREELLALGPEPPRRIGSLPTAYGIATPPDFPNPDPLEY